MNTQKRSHIDISLLCGDTLIYFIAKMQGWGNNTHRTTTFIGRMKSEAYQPRL